MAFEVYIRIDDRNIYGPAYNAHKQSSTINFVLKFFNFKAKYYIAQNMASKVISNRSNNKFHNNTEMCSIKNEYTGAWKCRNLGVNVYNSITDFEKFAQWFFNFSHRLQL